MGQENLIPEKNNLFEYKPKNNNLKISKSFFEFLYVIGRGGFGKVWKVKHKKTSKQYALKEMSKLKIIDRKSVKSIKTEREFLSKLNHPFLVNMIYSFQDSENLYLVMDLFLGGDLRYHICHKKHFDEIQSKFFCACVILGLEYIHKNNIIHRDIKPENLVLNEKGYLAITDFGIAKKNKPDNSSETSGTPGYMAPEVLCAQNHSFPVDFFAVGVMCYELLKGFRPYLGRNRQEIKDAVLARQAHIHRKDLFENGWSLDAGNFINKMLYRKPYKRLGYEGINEIKECNWFKNFNWDDLLNKKIMSPYIPKYGDNFDKKYCEAKENIDKETIERYQIYRNKESFKNIFLDYTFIREEEKDKNKNNEKIIIQNNNTSSSTKSSSGHNNFNYKLIKKFDEKENRSNNEISDEIKNPIEINIFSKNEIDEITNKFNDINLNQYKNNLNYDKNININNQKNINCYTIKKISEFFEEPIIELDNYKSIKENKIVNIYNNLEKNNLDPNNILDNNIYTSNGFDKNENDENNQMENNTIYNLKNENNKKELNNKINNLNNYNNNSSNLLLDNENRYNSNSNYNKINKQKNILYNFDTNNNIKNNNISLVGKNKTPNNIGKNNYIIKEKTIKKNKISNNINILKSNKTKLSKSNNAEIKEQRQRASSLSQNRALKKCQNNESMKKGKSSNLFSANKINKNETKNKCNHPQKELNSHSRSYKSNNNENGLIISLSNNINIKNNNKNNYNSKINENKNNNNYNNKILQSKNIIYNNYNNNDNNYNIIYNYGIPIHSSKNNKNNEQNLHEFQKNNNYKNMKIINQNKRVLNYIKKGNNVIKKDIINDSKAKNKIIENKNIQENNNKINNKKQKIIYKVSSMKILKSYNSNNKEISNNSNSNKKNNKTTSGKFNKSLNNMRSQTVKITHKTNITNNIQNPKKKKNVSVKTFD